MIVVIKLIQLEISRYRERQNQLHNLIELIIENWIKLDRTSERLKVTCYRFVQPPGKNQEEEEEKKIYFYLYDFK